jgi:Tfp pilus assembly PilM family ATPase
MIGLEFNDKYVKVVELKETPQGLTLTKYGLSPLQKKAPDEELTTTIANTINQVMSEAKILDTEVTTVISGPLVQIRRVSLPPMPEGELREAANYEARNFATFPVENAVVDYYLIEKAAAGGTNKNDVLVVAIEKETLKAHLNAISEAGLRVVGTTLAPLALGEVLQRIPTLPKGELTAALDFGLESASLCLFKNNIPRFTREISLSDQLASELQSSFTYYREQFFGEKVSRLYLSGESPRLAEFKEILSGSLGIPTEIIDPFVGINLSPKLDQAKLKEAAPRLTLVTGLAENQAKDLNLLAKKEKAPQTEVAKFIKALPIPNAAVLGALGLTLILVLGSNLYLTLAIEKTRKELNLKNQQLSRLGRFQERKAIYDAIKTEKVEFRNILGRIANLLPSGTLLASLTFDREKEELALIGEARSPQEVSQFVQDLDASAYFTEVHLKEIKKEGKVITFLVYFKAKPDAG